jgi:hypothetical protein
MSFRLVEPLSRIHHFKRSLKPSVSDWSQTIAFNTNTTSSRSSPFSTIPHHSFCDSILKHQYQDQAEDAKTGDRKKIDGERNVRIDGVSESR